MHLEDMRDKLAHRIAGYALEGIALPLSTHAYALDLGLDVQAIEARPHDHIIPMEELSHG